MVIPMNDPTSKKTGGKPVGRCKAQQKLGWFDLTWRFRSKVAKKESCFFFAYIYIIYICIYIHYIYMHILHVHTIHISIHICVYMYCIL